MRSAIGQFQGSVTSLVGVQAALSSFEWFLIVGVVLFALGLVVVALGGGGVLQQTKRAPTNQVKRDPGSCRYCGASMNGSTTYCPNCGKSQS